MEKHVNTFPANEVPVKHDNITDIATYMTHHSKELRERILRDFPALHRMGDPLSQRIDALRRKPFPARIAIMGIVKRWED
jgi:hypothetical protein